jgi:hypothetical protein
MLKTAFLFDYWKEFNLTQYRHKEIAENKQRKCNLFLAKLWLGKKTMAKQAKVLNNVELIEGYSPMPLWAR